MRFYTRQHPFYCGIDLHARWMYVCILSQDGEIVYHENLLAGPEAFLKAVAPYRSGLIVGVECVFTWYWLADLCRAEGIEFVLGHALYMRAIHGAKVKNDKVDWLQPWKREQRVAIYRKKVHHKSPKNYQLDLFDPSDGHWEYSAITTNKTIGLRALWYFMAGRGTHEKVLGELKSGFAFDAVPTLNYAANSTWQVLSILAYNLVTGFQIATSTQRLQRSRKRTALFRLKSIHTLRYELFNRAGLLQRPLGRATLTLARNLPTRRLFETVVEKLGRAASFFDESRSTRAPQLVCSPRHEDVESAVTHALHVEWHRL